jgi:hypothetical protein
MRPCQFMIRQAGMNEGHERVFSLLLKGGRG